MRYGIMLQLVSFIFLVLIGTAALFAWIQNRTVSEQSKEDYSLIWSSKYS